MAPAKSTFNRLMLVSNVDYFLVPAMADQHSASALKTLTRDVFASKDKATGFAALAQSIHNYQVSERVDTKPLREPNAKGLGVVLTVGPRDSKSMVDLIETRARELRESFGREHAYPGAMENASFVVQQVPRYDNLIKYSARLGVPVPFLRGQWIEEMLGERITAQESDEIRASNEIADNLGKTVLAEIEADLSSKPLFATLAEKMRIARTTPYSREQRTRINPFGAISTNAELELQQVTPEYYTSSGGQSSSSSSSDISSTRPTAPPFAPPPKTTPSPSPTPTTSVPPSLSAVTRSILPERQSSLQTSRRVSAESSSAASKRPSGQSWTLSLMTPQKRDLSSVSTTLESGPREQKRPRLPEGASAPSSETSAADIVRFVSRSTPNVASSAFAPRTFVVPSASTTAPAPVVPSAPAVVVPSAAAPSTSARKLPSASSLAQRLAFSAQSSQSSPAPLPQSPSPAKQLSSVSKPTFLTPKGKK